MPLPEDAYGVLFIPLTQGKFACIDIVDYPLVSGSKWSIKKKKLRVGEKYYAKRPRPKINGIRPMQVMHRAILKPESHQLIDHKDGNGLNNRRGNLRVATQSENSRNISARRSATGFLGVSKLTNKAWYAANLDCLGKHYYLGIYRDPSDAARAYDKKANEMFGEFANLNFPDDA